MAAELRRATPLRSRRGTSGCWCPMRTAGRSPDRFSLPSALSCWWCGCAPGRSRTFDLPNFATAETVWRAFRHSLRHLLPLAMWAVLLAVVLWFLFWLRIYPPQFGVWLWQKLPESLRFASPRQLAQYADWLLWLLMLGAVAKWLPIATTIAVSGFGKQALRSWRVLLRPLYWVWFCVLVLRRRLPSLQADLVDSRRGRSSQTGLEHGPALLRGVRDCDHGLDRAGVDGGRVDRKRRFNRGFTRMNTDLAAKLSPEDADVVMKSVREHCAWGQGRVNSSRKTPQPND